MERQSASVSVDIRVELRTNHDKVLTTCDRPFKLHQRKLCLWEIPSTILTSSNIALGRARFYRHQFCLVEIFRGKVERSGHIGFVRCW